MPSTSASSSDYAPLLRGDHGFILALALTVVITLALSSVTKIYFTWRRFSAMGKHVGSTGHALLTSDAMWLLAHVVAFAYLGVRISTLAGLTEQGPNALGSAQKSVLASANRACQILFILALYLSFCSVLCAALAIRTVTTAGGSVLRSPTYVAPLVVFVIGLLLCTLPLIGCEGEHIFPGLQNLCPSANARLLPVMVLIMVLDTGLAISWVIFVCQRNLQVHAGRSPPGPPWPVAPFVLRLLIVGTNIAYTDLYVRFNKSSVPYFSLFYPELLSLLVSLTATTSVSMSRILGKFNFAGVAYTVDPRNRSRNQSALTGSGSGTRTGNNTQTSNHAGRHLSSVNMDGWKDRSATLRSKAGVIAGRRGSAESEAQILPHDGIVRKVEIQQVWEENTSSKSQNESL